MARGDAHGRMRYPDATVAVVKGMLSVGCKQASICGALELPAAFVSKVATGRARRHVLPADITVDLQA